MSVFNRMLYSSRVMVKVKIRSSVWLDSGYYRYAHVFLLLSDVTVTLPSTCMSRHDVRKPRANVYQQITTVHKKTSHRKIVVNNSSKSATQ